MPYVSCPHCSLAAYTAARFSTVDECARCGRPLSGAPRATLVPQLFAPYPRREYQTAQPR